MYGNQNCIVASFAGSIKCIARHESSPEKENHTVGKLKNLQTIAQKLVL